MNSQADTLLAALRKGPLTTGDIHRLGIGRPAARILNLRQRGHSIITRIKEINTMWGVSRIARYTLKKQPVAKAA
ncbi:MAG: hypothetical protein IMF06_05435 [Proteobacteria bacterium]|nr:hypothetical protein [Pseudomonadota bacterium]